MSHESTRHTTITNSAIIQYGMSLARINAHFGTGVTFIYSMVPASFSPTIFSVGRKPHISIITMANRAGIINTL